MKNRKATKVALTVSAVMLAASALMGAGSSVAWFKQEKSLVNQLSLGEMQLALSYKTGGKYQPVEEDTSLFSSNALYEPGFTRVCYLKLENTGTVPFDVDLALVQDTAATVLGDSVLGNKIDLADYIRCGVVFAPTEEALEKLLADRTATVAYAVNTVEQSAQSGGALQPGQTEYAAVILHFPEDAGNAANYRGRTAPQIGFGIAARANQITE